VSLFPIPIWLSSLPPQEQKGVLTFEYHVIHLYGSLFQPVTVTYRPTSHFLNSLKILTSDTLPLFQYGWQLHYPYHSNILYSQSSSSNILYSASIEAECKSHIVTILSILSFFSFYQYPNSKKVWPH
jgi:hypothetical protein